MTNDHERSRLDGIIDAVVHDLMQTDGRGDLAAPVRARLDQPDRRAWFTSAPALATACLAVLVLAVTVLMLVRPAVYDVPRIDVASGLPASIEWPRNAPRASEIPAPPPSERAADAPPASADVPSSESIFGPRRGQVGAASLPPAGAVWLELTLVETPVSGEPRRHAVTMVFSRDAVESRAAESRAEGSFQISVVPEAVSSGVKLSVHLRAPFRRQFTATVRPTALEGIRIFEEVDPGSGLRTTIEARARFLKPEPQR